MSHLPEDGGPAFPHAPYSTSASHWSDGSQGMTLRDWFAGMALQWLLSGDLDDTKSAFARHAYEMADAMLAARGKDKA